MESEDRLRAVPWRALAGIGPTLGSPIGAVLASEPAERVLDRFLRTHRELSGDGRRAVAEAVFGVGLWRRRLAHHAGLPPTAPAPESAALLLATLLRDLGGVHAAEAATLSGLAPATLPPARPAPDDPALRYSLPDWLAATLLGEVGCELEALADAMNQPGPVCLRPNRLLTTSEALQARLCAEGVATRPGHVEPSSLVVTSPRPNVYNLAAYRAGEFEVQDEGSQLLGSLLAARPGERILDLCAGAGGKALQLAAAVGHAGVVHATDIERERLGRLARRAERAGVGAIIRVHGEAPPSGLVADRAIVDAPCSELGALRRGPDVRFRLDPRSFERLPRLQLSLLERAARHLRPGGRLLYGTCTVRREENEEVAVEFERTHPEFERIAPALHGDLVAGAGFVRTWPHRHGCDGFFGASWLKRQAP